MGKFCFYSWNALTDIFGEMGRYMSQNAEVTHVVYGHDEASKLKSTGIDHRPYILQDYLAENWHERHEESLEFYQDKYQLPNIMKLVYADRHIRDYRDMGIIRRFVLLHIRFWEDFFQREKPDYLVSEAVSNLSLYLAYLIGKYYGCVYLGITHSRISGKFYIAEDEYGYNRLCDQLYEGGKDEVYEAVAVEFAGRFIAEKLKPSYMKTQSAPPRLGNPRRVTAYFQSRREIDYFYTNGNASLLTVIKNRVQQKLRFHFLTKFAARFYDLPIKGEKYILFPIHFQPESTTMVQAPYFENQLAVIENLAKCLPADVMLYAKDHYAAIGSKTLEFYRGLKKFPNVKIINPFVESHSLVKDAEIIITITGTVGWEAILYNKPVIILGNVFYDKCPGVHKISDFSLMPAIIKQLLTRQEPQNEENQPGRRFFVAAYLSSLYTGEFNADDLEITVRPDNIANLCYGLLNYVNRRNWS